jgi:hypothetical protein
MNRVPIAVEFAKHVFEIAATNAAGKVGERKRLTVPQG